jgi:hypothetical protein
LCFDKKGYFEKCSHGKRVNWKNVDFDTFIGYKCNLAFNRQTRMLAVYDSNFTVCDYIEKRDTNKSFYDRELLRRAKLGLGSLAFFGIAEYQDLSRQLFSKTFNDKLVIKTTRLENLSDYDTIKKYSNVKGESKLTTKELLNAIDSERQESIKAVNLLDIKLYKYAMNLFNKRLRSFYLI